jgi:hypothetical protein
MDGNFLFECFSGWETKIPTLYGVGITKNYGWMGNNNPHHFGWGLKS